jgi:hypothetical protein
MVLLPPMAPMALPPLLLLLSALSAVSGEEAPPPLPTRCTGDLSCSFNGVCSAAGTCECEPAWKGRFCETLAVEPGGRQLGYQASEGGLRLSSWGGAPLRADDGTYHLIASEMINHAGLVPWGCNSRVIHATSADPLTQPFVKQRVLWETFSHEPRCARVPTGAREFVCYFSHNPDYPSAPCAGRDGSTDQESCRCNNGGDKPTYMSYSSSLDAGNWSTPVLVVPSKVDLNFSPFIYPNGSVHALYRGGQRSTAPCACSLCLLPVLAAACPFYSVQSANQSFLFMQESQPAFPCI